MDTLENQIHKAESRLNLLKSTIKIQNKIIEAMEERIELMKQNHKFEIENYYTKKIKL
jgi:hypothetical protein